MTRLNQLFSSSRAKLPVQLPLLYRRYVASHLLMKELLLFIFTKILLGIRSKIMLSCVLPRSCKRIPISFPRCNSTVIAVVISVAVGFYSIYRQRHRAKRSNSAHDHTTMKKS
ncbi:hypothetical protein OH492_07125 [Vibrio chagasii]|nr:hypothetical protein [Vibrio chagasii]